MMKVYYDKDADLSLVKGRKVAIIGYGSQGHAHALNLGESGVKVTVGLRRGGGSWEKAKKAGLAVKEIGNAVKGADIVMILLPDEHHAQIYGEHVEPNIRKGASLAFAHGFNIHYSQIQPRSDLDVFMVAPKAPGHTVRSTYAQGGGVPMLIAVHQNPSGRARDLALSYATAIGGGKAGVIETTFKEETETDLFGEQTVLCGGCVELGKAGFAVLVAEGVSENRNYSISNNAEYGEYVTGPKVINAQAREAMRAALARIQTGEYAKDFILENRAGAPTLLAHRRLTAEHPIEKIGAKLRDMMPWIRKNRLVDQSRN